MMSSGINQNMQEYLNYVVDVSLELYKSAYPELVSKVCSVPIEEVDSLTCEQIKENLFNMKIDFQQAKSKDEERISYDCGLPMESGKKYITRKEDIINSVMLLKLYTPEVSKEMSQQEIKSIRMLEDLDYITHELGHAFEAKIIYDTILENPSYLDYLAPYLLKLKGEEPIFDKGEAFAISMERIILDKLSETESYGISKADIEELWTRKRINRLRIRKS